MNKPRWFLAALAVSFLLVGLIEPHLPNYGQIYSEIAVAHTFAIAVLMFAWCRADAEARGVAPRSAPLFVALIPPIGVPYYFFRTMPWRQALLACLEALGFILVLGVLMVVAHAIGENIAI